METVIVVNRHRGGAVAPAAEPSNAWLYSPWPPLVGAMFDPSGVDDLANQPVGTGPYALGILGARRIHQARRPRRLLGHHARHQERDAALLRRCHCDHQRPDRGDVDLVYNMQAPELLAGFQSKPEYQVIEGTSNGEICSP